jgi:hypothetical protein
MLKRVLPSKLLQLKLYFEHESPPGDLKPGGLFWELVIDNAQPNDSVQTFRTVTRPRKNKIVPMPRASQAMTWGSTGVPNDNHRLAR